MEKRVFKREVSEVLRRIYFWDIFKYEDLCHHLEGKIINKHKGILGFCPFFGCGAGWYPLIIKTARFLEKLSKTFLIEVRCHQIKQKYGGLRIYFSTRKKDIFSVRKKGIFTPFFRLLKKVISVWQSTGEKKAFSATLLIEEESTRICEVCGEEGELCRTDTGWLITLCRECRKRMGAEKV